MRQARRASDTFDRTRSTIPPPSATVQRQGLLDDADRREAQGGAELGGGADRRGQARDADPARGTPDVGGERLEHGGPEPADDAVLLYDDQGPGLGRRLADRG